LSAPGKNKEVARAQKVWCDYIDETGNKRQLSEGGLCSVIIQHELDHFEGWCEVFSEYKENI
jgi:peptide deformylase